MPTDDPEARHLRRFGRDLAELERRRREGALGTGAPRHREESGDESGDEAPRALAAWTEEELERIPSRAKHGRRRADDARRRAARVTAEVEPQPPAPDATTAPLRTGIVTATSRGPCEVELDDGRVVAAQLPKALARDDRSVLAVGDRVELAPRPSGDLVVTRRLPRTSRLSRPDPFQPQRERVLAANLDLAVVVASLRNPPLSTGLLDRFLVALQHGGVAAAIAVNKCDLGAEDDGASATLALLAPYREIGVPLVLCSARTGLGLDEIRRWIAGRTVAFVGHSGVGKSSLLNALAPEADAAIGDISTRHGKGRHTTTGARVYRLAGGARVIDTPGVREFGLWRLAPRELAVYFDEFERFAADCHFSDCTHVHEPNCAVRAAAERSAIPPERFATYLRILASFERD